jgi:hypothetical protein
MKKITQALLVLSALILYSSCDSEDVNDIQTVDNFYALTVGNSWEYTYYFRDFTTIGFVETPVRETVDITHTVEIDNKTFYNFRHRIYGNDGSNGLLPQNEEKNFVLRDSLGFLVGRTGQIVYSSDSYEEHVVFVGGPPYASTYNLQLLDKEVSKTTNAGTFSCLDNEYFYIYTDGSRSVGTSNTYRANGIGEVVVTFSMVSLATHFMEKRLESYSLQ